MGTSRIHVIALVVILSAAGFGGAVDADSAFPAVAVAAPAPDFDAATAARLAVNRIEPAGVGLRLHHPRRQVDFTPEGIRVSGRRGTSWSWQLTGVRSAAGRSLIEAQTTLPAAAGREKVVYDHGALQEEYLLGTDSIEQRFVLPLALPLAGEDLVVLGAVSSSGTFSESARGWRWRDSNGEVTLGRVTVADASGRTLPCRFEVSSVGTRLTVEGAALAGAVYPVVIDPEIGSNDVRISDMGPDGDAAYDALNPAVAYNNIDNNYLVVWEGDDTPGDLVEGEMEIFGQIVGATGSQVGYSDVRISHTGPDGNTAYRARNPAVAFNTVYNQFLVAWEADNPEAGLADNEFEIWGQVVDPL
ncbi:MAG: large repetitive protein, partial [Acidobacteriota bacterium]|nr:large repetitive protein [Acidobacteriota bacterium]